MKGYAQNKVVVNLIQLEFFAKKVKGARAGIVFADLFNPFPLELLAIAITTVSSTC